MADDFEEIYMVQFVHHSGDAPIKMGQFDTFGRAMEAALRCIKSLTWSGTNPKVEVLGDMEILAFHIYQDEANPPWVQIRKL